MNHPNITAEIIADSLNEFSNRLTTYVCTFPRIILAEVNTHRMLSRNSASSRAIPVIKQIEKVDKNPFMPVQFGKNCKGMQAQTKIEAHDEHYAIDSWLQGKQNACATARMLADLGVHKQLANRVLEPYSYTTAIISATAWHNFFKLRAHPDAQPEFQVLAYRMLEAYLENTPKELSKGEWHIPFGNKMPDSLTQEEKIKVAVARCARVSYENFDGEININSDFELYDNLLKSGHLSPFEHVACASGVHGLRSGNFIGFIQHRDQVEIRKTVDLVKIMESKPDWV